MVKTPFFHSQSAGVWVEKKLIFFDFQRNKNQFSTTITALQRLNAREQAWLTGMCEADGSTYFFRNKYFVVKIKKIKYSIPYYIAYDIVRSF